MIQKASAAVSRFGGLDVVVNNAGYIWNTTVQKTTDEQWQAMLDVHATAPFRVLRATGPGLLIGIRPRNIGDPRISNPTERVVGF